MILFLDITMAPNTMFCQRNQVTYPVYFQALTTPFISMAGINNARLAILASQLLNLGIPNAMMFASTSILTAYTLLPHKHLLVFRLPNPLS